MSSEMAGKRSAGVETEIIVKSPRVVFVQGIDNSTLLPLLSTTKDAGTPGKLGGFAEKHLVEED
jgi:hypothetical protein